MSQVDIFGVPLEVGQRVVYAMAWHQYAALHVGTLIALAPSLVIRPESGQAPVVRPACAIVVITERGTFVGTEARDWLRRRLGEFAE